MQYPKNECSLLVLCQKLVAALESDGEYVVAFGGRTGFTIDIAKDLQFHAEGVVRKALGLPLWIRPGVSDGYRGESNESSPNG